MKILYIEDDTPRMQIVKCSFTGNGAAPSAPVPVPEVDDLALDPARAADPFGLDPDTATFRALESAALVDAADRIAEIWTAPIDGEGASTVGAAARGLKASAAILGADRLASLAVAVEQDACAGSLPDPSMLCALRNALAVTRRAANERDRRGPTGVRIRHVGVLAVVVGLISIAFAVATALVVRGVVDDQEQRLLRERGRELAGTPPDSVASLDASLPVLARLAGIDRSARKVEFARAAAPLLSAAVAAVAAAESRSGVLRVAAAVGQGPRVGDPLRGPRASLIRRALASGKLVTARVTGSGGSHLVVAKRGGRFAAYQEWRVDPTRPARRPLVGQFATDLPWIILVGGLIVSLLLTTLVPALVRRR